MQSITGDISQNEIKEDTHNIFRKQHLFCYEKTLILLTCNGKVRIIRKRWGEAG